MHVKYKQCSTGYTKIQAINLAPYCPIKMSKWWHRQLCSHSDLQQWSNCLVYVFGAISFHSGDM